MSLHIELNRNAEQALYQQIVEQIKAHICDGRLPSAAQLPTVRQLAKEVGVTRLTVQNAYSELQSEGWVEATIGRGTFVSETVEPRAVIHAITAMEDHHMTVDSVMNDMMQINQFELTEGARLRSMAVASPDPKLFPEDEFWSAMSNLKRDFASLISYGPPQGDPVLRIEMADALSRRGVYATAEDVIITNGLTQGLSLTVRALGRPGDVVLVEQPTYLGFLNILKAHSLQPVGIPLDSEGPRLDFVERVAVQHRPRFFYTIPSFQNPTGQCTTPERRKALLELAERYGFMLLEDDIYGRLAFDGDAPRTIKADDRNGLVVFLTSESKVLMPGLRIGSVVAPTPLHGRLLAARRSTDLGSPTLSQRALALFMREGGMQRHLKRTIPVYRRRRNAMVAALRRYMPKEATWTEPAGGFCCWLTLPNAPALNDIHRVALQHGLALAPGDVFLAQPDGHKHLRLSYGTLTEEAIRQSIALLSELIQERLDAEGDHRPIFDFTPLV